jgi:hypothetical protein
MAHFSVLNIQTKYTLRNSSVNSGEFTFHAINITEPGSANRVKPVEFDFPVIDWSSNEKYKPGHHYFCFNAFRANCVSRQGYSRRGLLLVHGVRL